MTSMALRHPEAAAVYRLARFVRRIAHGLYLTARRLDTSLEARRRLAAARRDLSEMTVYELRDIGLRPWDIDSVARGGSPRAADAPWT